MGCQISRRTREHNLLEQKHKNKNRVKTMTTTLKTGQFISCPQAVIAVYNTHPEAKAAIKELQRGGFDMENLSVVSKDYHTDEHVVGYYNAGDRMVYSGKLSPLWGELWGLLFDAAFFWVPGMGSLLIAGPLASSLVAALDNAAVKRGLSALRIALYNIGIPKDNALRYATAIEANKYLFVAQGTAAEVAKAKGILETTKPVALDEHALKAARPVVVEAGRGGIKPSKQTESICTRQRNQSMDGTVNRLERTNDS
jgi:uncharacterized membrane protein